MNVKTRIGSLAAVAALAIAGCGTSHAATARPATIRAHGTFAEGMMGTNCGLSPGDQVKITTPGGKLLASPVLGSSYTKTIHTSGISVPVTVLPYAATVPVEAKYGLTSGGLPVYYVSQAQMRHGVDLSC